MRFLTLTSVATLAVGPALAASKNPFSAEFWKLSNTDFIVLVAFILFIAVLFYFKVPGMIGKMLDDRASGIQSEIDEARAVALADLPDPVAQNDNLGSVDASDENRTLDEAGEWLVMMGVCTHLGCVPLGDAGDFGGWFCPCHGSHYDTAGRIRKGPAPTNLPVPVAEFVDETTIKLG